MNIDDIDFIENKQEFTTNLLKLIAKNELWDHLYWTNDLIFYFICNDVFYWGTVDDENIENEEDLTLLEKCISDVQKVDIEDENDIILLYCCRRRKMRPQGAMYKHIDEKLWALFDECGPEREVNFFNPQKQPKE